MYKREPFFITAYVLSISRVEPAVAGMVSMPWFVFISA